jgi:hypothetical protein
MFESSKEKHIVIQDVYPDLSPEEQTEAEHNLKEYVLLVWRIFQRLEREDPEILTEALKNDRVHSTD